MRIRWLRYVRQRLNAMGLRQVWRAIIFVMGTTVVLLGILMIALPGPAIVVIPAGLAVLGLEYRWARRWLRQVRFLFQKGVQSVSQPGRSHPPPDAAPPPQPPAGAGPGLERHRSRLLS